MKTQTIANQVITLIEGERYFASRPVIKRGRRVYPVTIKPLGHSGGIVVIDGLTYEQANELINGFNNEVCSLSGRVW